MKRIAIFIDGTWNRPDAENPTNVVLLSQCVRQRAEGGMPQVVLYSPGVGSGRGNNRLARRLDRLLGGALGWGLTDIIEDAYRQLVFLYEPGDEIMVFGFSRGAFAARSLVGLIRSSGICGRDKLAMIPEAMARYISRAPGHHPNDEESHKFRLRFAPDVTTNTKEMSWRIKNGHRTADVVPLKIAYLGVWDTVSALGLPERLPLANRFNAQYRFHDAKLSSMVLAARHAIAIDERRTTFPSYPWDNMPELNEKYEHFVPEYLQEWFPGNHGSVGGGGSRKGLSSIALTWIALGAAKAGLAIDWARYRTVATDFDVTTNVDNKFGPTGLASILNAMSSDRAGPQDLSELSMAAVDRFFLDKTYWHNPTLAAIYHELRAMTEDQREDMREAHRLTDRAFTHRPGEATWPGPPSDE